MAAVQWNALHLVASVVVGVIADNHLFDNKGLWFTHTHSIARVGLGSIV